MHEIIHAMLLVIGGSLAAITVAAIALTVLNRFRVTGVTVNGRAAIATGCIGAIALLAATVI